ncbi:hypothetical protein BZA77DRAFT_42546 [Pyronema omphalodes]|nr:hypothetical protein BZA77DRAFT_42546 [Pyronema omphalodes]
MLVACCLLLVASSLLSRFSLDLMIIKAVVNSSFQVYFVRRKGFSSRQSWRFFDRLGRGVFNPTPKVGRRGVFGRLKAQAAQRLSSRKV